MSSATLFYSNPLVTISPDTFDNVNQWNYRQLQELCMELNLGGKGSRAELIIKLLDWNTGALPEVLPSAKKLESTDLLSDSCSTDSEGSDEGDTTYINNTCAPPSSTASVCLAPLMDKPRDQPPKSILRTQSAYCATGVVSLAERHNRSIVFSPFNGVRLIPSRRAQFYETLHEEEDESSSSCCYDEDDDIDFSEEDDYSDEESDEEYDDDEYDEEVIPDHYFSHKK